MNAEPTSHNVTYHVAFDCGNSSFRIMLGTYMDGKFIVEVIDQIPNNLLIENGYLYWDIQTIFSGLKLGLKKAYSRCGRIDSVGVTTWGIDFGLLDSKGSLVANPLCYRNTLGVESLQNLSADEQRFNWTHSGIQNHPMNSLYQLLGIRAHLPEHFGKAARLLFIPDLIIYLFTGEMATERSIASTSQIYDVLNGSYSDEILDYFSLDKALLPKIVGHGDCVGFLSEHLQRELEMPACPFICTPSHDTASAVAAMPTLEKNQLFISSGTWSLIGAELDAPILSGEAERFHFANEAGVFSTTTFLKNSTGLYLLQEMKKYLQSVGNPLSWDEISKTARERGLDIPVFDPNHPDIFSTRNMYETLCGLVGERDYRTIIASCYLSLVLCYQKTIEEISLVTERDYARIHVIGGGCRDTYLNQLTADITRMEVCTGPVEAASIGNLSVQRRFLQGQVSLQELRQAVIDSTGGEREIFVPAMVDGPLIYKKIQEYRALFS
jgi:sugar (pentulose or hexulose) kinase